MTVANLTGEVLRTMIWIKLKMNAAAVLTTGLLAAGAAVVAGQAGALPGQGGGVKANANVNVPNADQSKARGVDPALFILTIDHAKAADLGLTPDVVGNTAAAALASTSFNQGDFWFDPVSKNQYFVGGPYPLSNKNGIEGLLDVTIMSARPDGSKRRTPLRNLVSLSPITKRQLEAEVQKAEAKLALSQVDLAEVEANVKAAQAALVAARDRLAKAARGGRSGEPPRDKEGQPRNVSLPVPPSPAILRESADQAERPH
jgi:hypothetical protein